MEYLARFHYTWEYRPGRINVADPLSRHPSLTIMATAIGTWAVLCAITRRQKQNLEKLQKTRAEHAEMYADFPVPTTVDQVNPLISEIRAAYTQDAWLTDEHKCLLTASEDGLLRRGEQVYVPDVKSIRENIIQSMHADPLGGHVGATRSAELISRYFWWPSLKKQVRDFVHSCDLCQRNKSSNLKYQGLLQPLPVPDKVWSSVSLDLITQLPLTPKGHDAIVVFVCRLTKMAHFIPTTTTVSAMELADIFVDNVVRLHGVPTSLISDRDPKFTSAFWAQVFARLGTKLGMSSSFHPETDGQTERMNRVLEDMLRHYVSAEQDNWDDLLACAEFAVNNSVNRSTGFTPFFLNYGVHPDTPVTVNTKSNKVPSADKYAEDLAERVSHAKRNMEAAQQRQKAYADLSRQEVQFEPGDRVLLNSKNIKFKQVGKVGSKKFMPKWIGPFTVKTMVGKAAVQLLLPSQYRIHDVFHVSLVSKYRESGRLHPPTPVEELEDGPVWSVGKVLTHKWRKVTGKILTEYLIQWKGQSPEQASWVPEANMSASDLASYWAQVVDDRPHPSPMLRVDGMPVTLSHDSPAPTDASAYLERSEIPAESVIPAAEAETSKLRRSERVAKKAARINLVQIGNKCEISVKLS